MAEQKPDPTGVLALVREKRDAALMECAEHPNCGECPACKAKYDYALLASAALDPLVDALVAQDDFYTHSADCVDEDCREEERLEGVAMSKRHAALAGLREQLQEKAGA